MLRQHDGSLARVDWDQAQTRVADGFKHVINATDRTQSHLPRAIAHRGLLRANKLMKGFLGSANVDTNSRCMASSVAGHRRAFGADTVPEFYEDLDQADLIVLAARCRVVLVLFRRIQENRSAGADARLVVIDPRRTDRRRGQPASRAIKPAWTGAVLRPAGAARRSRCVRSRLRVEPHDRLRAGAERAAKIAPDARRRSRAPPELDAADVAAFYDLFAATESAPSPAYSQGVNQ